MSTIVKECFSIGTVIISKTIENKYYLASIETGKEEITKELFNIFKEQYQQDKENN